MNQQRLMNQQNEMERNDYNNQLVDKKRLQYPPAPLPNQSNQARPHMDQQGSDDYGFRPGSSRGRSNRDI